ncbi:MAG: hypothetical protein HOP08_08350 [Cyclobacteriaceae bacterium]|nr:hypothetical protein [Cyclobacteriaceae bacterium]
MNYLRSQYLLTVLLAVIASTSFAQQNLFNVPSSDITSRNKLFYQQQLNFTSGFIQFNTTFSYGLRKNMEVGVNLVGLNLNKTSSGPSFITNASPSTPPFYPYYTVNFQKAFPLNNVFKIAIGTQTGLSDNADFGSYIYSNFVSVLPNIKTKIITGIYWGSDSFLGPEDRSELLPQGTNVGTQIGIEQPILKERFFLIVENISGRHSLGETSLGSAWLFSKHWMLSMVCQFPNYQGQSTKSLGTRIDVRSETSLKDLK